jgi:hypothetical protein
MVIAVPFGKGAGRGGFVPRCLAVAMALALSVLAVGATRAFAASPPLRAELSANEIGRDETVELTVVVTAGAIDGSPEFETSEDFEVEFLGNATSVQILNGEVRSELRFNYRLSPKRDGALTTPSGSISIDGQVYDVAPLEVRVATVDTARREQPRTTWVTQKVDTNTVFVGEQLTNTIEIVTSKQLFEAQFGDLTFDGFRHIDIGDEQRSVRLVDGVPHTAITLRKALFPLTAGALTIPSRVLRAKIRVRRAPSQRRWPFDDLNSFSDDLFGDLFGGGELRSVELRTDALAIVVNPLPPPPPGAITWGLATPIVGHTGINVIPEQTTVPFGDAIAATVKIASAGNISLIESLPFPASPDVRVYQEPPRTKVIDSNGVIITEKTFAVSFVPQRGGVITIPALQLTTFDPRAGVYKMASSRQFDITVEGGPAVAEAPHQHTVPTELASDASESTETYEPLTVWGRFSAAISLGSALLVCGVLCGGGVVIVGIRRTLERKRRRDGWWAAVGSSADPTALRASFRAALAAEFGLGSDAQLREVIANWSAAERDREGLFALAALADAIDEADYGRGQVSDFEGLRRRAEAFRAILPPQRSRLRRSRASLDQL